MFLRDFCPPHQPFAGSSTLPPGRLLDRRSTDHSGCFTSMMILRAGRKVNNYNNLENPRRASHIPASGLTLAVHTYLASADP
jgi:hypothetical protein